MEAVMDPGNNIFSVSEYIEVINEFLKREEIRLIGEVSQVKQASSGHVYFSLKDQQAEAVMECVIWKSNYFRCGVKIEAGMELIIAGRPQVYAPTGRFSFVADTVELHGEGKLKKAYDELRKKLETEGLFAQARKREFPELPRRIGIITSREGAVIHDFLGNIGKFGFEMQFVDSRVEGAQAVKPLIEAIRTLRKKDIEVLVVIRGGGSLESLQAFNNEALVREIAGFPVPVIAGIGHDKDVPLMALAADYMVSTPTAAAHLLSRSWEEAYTKIRQVPHLLVRLRQEFARIRSDLDLSWSAIIDHAGSRIEGIAQFLSNGERILKLNDPGRQLKLGYSIVRKHGTVLKSVEGAVAGEMIETELSDGIIESKVI